MRWCSYSPSFVFSNCCSMFLTIWCGAPSVLTDMSPGRVNEITGRHSSVCDNEVMTLGLCNATKFYIPSYYGTSLYLQFWRKFSVLIVSVSYHSESKTCIWLAVFAVLDCLLFLDQNGGDMIVDDVWMIFLVILMRGIVRNVYKLLNPSLSVILSYCLSPVELFGRH